MMASRHKILLTVFCFLLCCFQLAAQKHKIGSIDVYGNRTIDINKILASIGIHEGDSLSVTSFDKKAIENRLKQIKGVQDAHIGTVCCDELGNYMIFAGVTETASANSYNPAPASEIQLPDSVINQYNLFSRLFSEGIRKGENSEDDSQGYALFTYAPAKEQQLLLIDYAQDRFPLLEEIIRTSKYSKHRAIAAQLIAYTKDKKKIVDPLLFAVNDEDEEVRNNATRAISVLVAYSYKHQELKISISPEPFIRMINSIIWTDRNKGASVLYQLTENKDQNIISMLKQSAIESLIEMAKWKSKGHAGFSFIILGRVAGWDDEKILKCLEQKDWHPFIDEMITSITKTN